MDEQNARTSEETCPARELKVESSNLCAADSVREPLPSAGQIQPAHYQQTTVAGDKSWQHFPDVTLSDREKVDGEVDDDAHMKDVTSFQSVITEGFQVDEDVKDTGELPGYVESTEIVHLDRDQNQHASASADNTMVDAAQDEQIDVDSKGVSATLAHVDGLQETGASDFVQEPVGLMMDENSPGEASLEMLSVAVESFENMQRQSEEGLKNASNVLENPGAEKEHTGHDFEHASIDTKSLMTKSTSESEDNESSVIDGTFAPRAEFQDKEHFLNLLCELAAVRQQECELSKISSQFASCITSLTDNDAACGEPRRLSFVDLLRKQMANAGAFTDLTADAIYEEFLRQNPEFLGSKVGKERSTSMPSAGFVPTLESEQKSSGTSDREGDTPTDEIIGDSRSGEIKVDLSKGGGLGDFKEETRNDDKRFGVGDLVWAKVKSHPWWPGQIFDAANASAAAKKIQKPGRTLVAFFGDGTFGWLQQSQLILFMPNFAEKVKQSTMKSFCRAVAEALDEVCRRTELGVRCSHSCDAVYSLNLFPDLNVGIQKGVRLRCHQDIEMSKERYHPERVLKFVQTTACAPLYPLSSGLEYSELCGHVYGFRSFMLSSNRPESKVTLLNMVKAQKKLKSVQSSLLKRRFGLDEPSGGPNLVGKEAKRLHLSKDDEVKEPLAVGRVQSPRFRSMEILLSTEAEESKASDSEVKSHEQVKGSTWLAKGKRLHVSPDCKEKKRARGWHSLGPIRDSTKSGCELTVDTLTSPDDDTKTLFDITGYHSLKKKKKGVLKSATNMLSKKVCQKPLEVKQEVSNKQLLASLDETMKEEGGFLDSGISSLSMMVSQLDPCLMPVTQDFGNVKGNKDTIDQLDHKNTDAEDFRNAEEGKQDTRDQLDLNNADAEVKGELVDLKADCTDYSEKEERELLDFEAEYHAEQNEKDKRELKAGVRDESEKDKEKLDVGVTEKNEKDAKVGDLDVSVSDEGELSVGVKESQSLPVGVNDIAKKQTKRLHPETGNTLRSMGKTKKRRQNSQDNEKVLLSENPPRKSVKTSKLGLSMRKVAGALKGSPTSLKSAKLTTTKNDLSATVDCEVSKDTMMLNLDNSLLRSQVPAVRSVNGENSNRSLAKLLSILQVVATDPLSSANMRSSLEGATSVFLKFRSMVFLKSSGYAAAAAGKLMPSIANGHLYGDKKADDKGRPGRKFLFSETQRTGLKDSSRERKALSKTVYCTGSVGGPGSQTLPVLDSPGEAKAVAIKGHHPLGATLGGQGSDIQNSSADNETASGETPSRGKIMTAGNQRLCVQELAVAARKRKSEVLQESATKVLGKREAMKGLPEKIPIEKTYNKERVADTRHYAKSVKHHISKTESLSLPEKRSSVQSSGNSKVARGLFMQFPQDYTLPSEAELKEVFNQFGTLENFGIRLYKNASTAQVVFKNNDDAEAAWQHARKNRMFGQANVSYRLRHFLLSSKSDSRLFNVTSAKKISLETRDLKVSSFQNLESSCLVKHSTSGSEKGVSLIPSHCPVGDSSLNRVQLDKGISRVREQSPVDKASSSRCEPLRAHSPPNDSMVSPVVVVGSRVMEQAPVEIASLEPVLTHSPVGTPQPGSSTLPVPSCVRSCSSSDAELGGSVRPPVLHQQEVIQCPSSQSTLVTNFFNPPPVSNVNVSSGDIQDQMMKLLQQVSVIVSSTSLTHKSS